MKTDRTALIWGTIIGVGIVVAIMVLPSEFVGIHVRLAKWEQDALMTGPTLCGLLIASYRALWKKLCFWVLLLGIVGANTLFYRLFADAVVGPQRFAVYGIAGGMEFLGFALVVFRLYRRGPDTRSWTGSKTR